MDLRIGRPVGTFDEEIDRHLSLLGRSEFWGGNYVRTGFYDDQLKRYFDRFPASNILIGIHEDLQADAGAFMDWIFDYIGLDSIPAINNTLINESRVPRFRHLNRWLYATGIKRQISAKVPAAIKIAFKKHCYTSQITVKISDAQYARLAVIFRDHIVELSRMLYRDLTPWLSNRKLASIELKPQ